MNPTSLLLDCITRTIRSIENPRGSCFVGARAQGDVVAQISDAPGQFEFEQRYPHCAPKPPPPGQLVERDGEGPSTVMIRSRAASASSPGRVRGVDCGSPRRALVHPACLSDRMAADGFRAHVRPTSCRDARGGGAWRTADPRGFRATKLAGQRETNSPGLKLGQDALGREVLLPARVAVRGPPHHLGVTHIGYFRAVYSNSAGACA